MAGGDVRRDEAPLDPSWEPPVEVAPTVPQQDPPSRRGPLVIGVAVVVLALIGGGLWLGGALDTRTDYGWDTAPGTIITAGPFELSFSEVTVQRTKDYKDQVTWEVRVLASGRTTADETLTPDTLEGSGMFLLQDPKTKSIYSPEVINWGPNNRISDGDGFTPGLPPVPFAVKFALPATYVPAATLKFGAFDQELRDNSLLKNQEPEWRNTVHYFRFDLPVRRLPDEKS